MVTPRRKTAGPRPARSPRRPGAALVLVMFIICIVTSLVVAVLQSETLEMAVTRNTLDHERAVYLANAGVHHACAELEADGAWRGTVSDGAYPANDTYQATAADDGLGGVLITSVGVSGAATRTVQATIEL